MPFPLLPALLTGGGFLGGLFGNKQKTQAQATTDPAFLPLQQQLLQQIMGRLQQPSALPQGFEERGIAGINDTFDDIGTTIGNSLISRGISASPMAGASDRNLNFARGGEIGRFRSSLPLVERDLRNQDLSLGASIFGLQPQNRTSETSTGSAGEGIGNISTILALMMGMQGGNQQGGNPFNTGVGQFLGTPGN